MKNVTVAKLDPRRFETVLDPDQGAGFVHRLEHAADQLAGRRLWHLNSTEQGGGVAEMLRFLLGYLNGADIDARWLVIAGNEPFFQITKRIHNLLHGQPGDGGSLGEPQRDVYRRTLQEAVPALQHQLAPGDIVVLHDPQTVGWLRP